MGKQFTVNKISKSYNIFLVESEDKYSLASAFLKPQEFYESKNENFKGKTFSIKDFRVWYAENQSNSKSFSYLDDWAGFNLPCNVYFECYMENDLENFDEHALYRELMRCVVSPKDDKNHIDTDSKSYLIGVTKGLGNKDTTLIHEIAHALFYLSDKYRLEVIKIINDLQKSDENLYCYCRDKLSEMGYHDDVILDEINAYAVSGDFEIKPSEIAAYKNFQKQIKKTFKKYWKNETIKN